MPATYRVTTDQGTYQITTDEGLALPGIPMPQAAQRQMQATDTGDLRGFGRSFLNAINPIPAIQDYIQHGSPAHRGLMAMSKLALGKPLGEEDDPTRLGAEGNAMTDLAAPGVTAGGQAAQGNFGGAAGTLAGGYGVPAAVAAASPVLARNAPRMRAAAKGAVKGAYSESMSPVQTAVGPIPTILRNMAVGAGTGEIPLIPGLPIRGAHPMVGAAAGASIPIIKGLAKGAKEGWQGATPDISPVEPVAQPATSPVSLPSGRKIGIPPVEPQPLASVLPIGGGIPGGIGGPPRYHPEIPMIHELGIDVAVEPVTGSMSSHAQDLNNKAYNLARYQHETGIVPDTTDKALLDKIKAQALAEGRPVNNKNGWEAGPISADTRRWMDAHLAELKKTRPELYGAKIVPTAGDLLEQLKASIEALKPPLSRQE